VNGAAVIETSMNPVGSEPPEGNGVGEPAVSTGSTEPGATELEIDGDSLPMPGGGLPARLGVSTSVFDFGGVHAGGEAEVFDWVISNTGGSTSGPMTLSNPTELAFTTQNGCQTPLAAGDECTIRVSFAPATTRRFSGELQLAHGAETLRLALFGKGQNRMAITIVGSGQVTSSPLGLSCEGNACVGLFDPVAVTFMARTENGSGSFFGAWSGGNCRARQACDFTMSQSGAVTATFRAFEHNLIFTSSSRHAPNAGGLAAYDAECNRLASAAGINDASGDAYIAAMSDGTTSLRQRLGAARGWVRMDGLQFADTPTSLFDDFAMLYYVAYDERGVQVPTPQTDRSSSEALDTLSGTRVDGGAAADHCNGWTSASADSSFHIGRVAGGPEAWIDAVPITCDSPLRYRIVCMGVTRSLALPIPTPAAALPAEVKQIWLTNTGYLAGSMSPDEKCQSERPLDVDGAVAFVAYTDRPAAAVIDPTGVYMRPDGVLVGTGADLISMDIYSTPWVRADGTVAAPLVALPSVLTGARNPSANALASENCNDWQDPSDASVGLVGSYGSGSTRYFFTGTVPRCNFSASLYCVEP
jgi:hypothetical protein